MRGLLFPYSFSSVVNSFFCVCVCMGKGKEGGNSEGRDRKRVESKGKNIGGNRVPALGKDRGEEINGRHVGYWLQRGFAMDNGRFCMNIFNAVPSLIFSKERKTSFKVVYRDLKCHSVSPTGCLPLSTYICAAEHRSWACLARQCSPWSLCCVLAYMPESRSFIPPGCSFSSLCPLSLSPLQITVGWTLSRTTDDRLDGLSQTSSPRLCDTMLQLQK